MAQLNHATTTDKTSRSVRTRRSDSRDHEVGRRVRARRLELGLSQTGLADLCGVTFQQVQKYEKGANRIGAGRLERISEALKVPVSFFFGNQATNGPVKDAGADGFWAMAQNSASIRVLRSLGKIKSRKRRLLLCELAEELEETA